MLNLPPTAIRLTEDIELWEIPNFATPEECEEIIREAHKKGFQISEVDDPKNAVTQSRTSTTAFLTSTEGPVVQKVGLRVKEIVGSYELEGLQVQKYEKTQKYNPHYDTFDGKDGKDQRNYTAMLYLNDVAQGNGGGTLFTNLNLRLIPKRGSLILWNNLKKDNCREEKTMHMGEPVEGDVLKYISTFWFHKTDEELCKNKGSFGVRPDTKDTKDTKAEAKKPLLEKFKEYFESNAVNFGLIIGILVIVLILIAMLILKFQGSDVQKKSIKIRT